MWLLSVLQCNSDINYPVLVCQISQVRAPSPIRLSSLQMPIASLGSLDHLYFSPIGHKFKDFDNLLEKKSQNSVKCYTYNYCFIRKDTNVYQSNEDSHRVRSKRISNTEFLLTSLHGVRMHQLLHIDVSKCLTTRSLT